jgi:2-alkyl-3-oxoalkanoate reductase
MLIIFMKILLTGATGFLGYRTLEKIVNLSYVHKVIATGRTIKLTHRINHPKVEYILGDLLEEHFVTSLVSKVDVIIHTAALSSPWGKQKDFYNTNVTIQKHLINAAVNFKINRIIYISTPSIYFELKDKLDISEDDPLPKKFINQYAHTKHLAEKMLKNGSIPYVIFRPRALIGRGDTIIMPRLIRAFDNGKLKIIGHGKNIVDLTYVGNVVDAIVLSLKTTKGINQVYNISNGEPVKLWDSISYVLKKLDKNLSPKKVPFILVKNVAKLMEYKSKMTNMNEPVLTTYGVGTLTKSFTLNIEKAKNLLNYNPTTTTKEAIDEFVSWYLLQNENEKS